MKLYIKYMVSLRCKLIVKEQLSKLGLHFIVADLGTVDVVGKVTSEQRELLAKRLKKSGMELLDDTKSSLIEKIKAVVIELVDKSEKSIPLNFMSSLSEQLGYQPKLLADTFSEVQGISIQQFIIFEKVERVKELLLYGDFTILEISRLLHFNSRANLSYQFKKVTGLTPHYYKVLKKKRKTNMARIGSGPLESSAGKG